MCLEVTIMSAEWHEHKPGVVGGSGGLGGQVPELGVKVLPMARGLPLPWS